MFPSSRENVIPSFECRYGRNSNFKFYKLDVVAHYYGQSGITYVMYGRVADRVVKVGGTLCDKNISFCSVFYVCTFFDMPGISQL